jgi:hypothetical protein
MALQSLGIRRLFLNLLIAGCAIPFVARPAAAEGVTLYSTAILVVPINQPHVVHADDGREHVEYDLLVTSAFVSPVTLTSIDISGPGGAVIGRIDGATLAAATQGVLGQTSIAAIPPSGSATVEIDLILPTGKVPTRLTNHITYAIPGATPHTQAIVSSLKIAMPEPTVSPFHAITILPPLTGAGWASINGCCTPNAHRNVRVAAGTRIGTAETFAIDFVRVDGDRFYQGNGATFAQYAFYGAPVHAVGAGVVVGLHDGMTDTIPLQVPDLKKPEDFGGNYVLIRQAPGVYAWYAHLQNGSVAVKMGQHVAADAVVGHLGNSGNSTNPHLHFGLLDRPDFIAGYSLPYVFAHYSMTGRIIGGDDDGTLHIQPDVRAVSHTYPLVGAIANYP